MLGLQHVASSLQHTMGEMSTNVLQLIICIITGVCCLLPLAISPKSNLEGSRLRASLPDQLHRESAVAVITLIVPLLLDITTDAFTSFFTKVRDAEVRKKSKRALFNNMEHLVFLCGAAIVPATAFIPSSNDNWAYIYISCRLCQLVLIGGAVAISLCRYDEKYWPVRVTYFVLVLLLLASSIGAFTNNYLAEEYPSKTILGLQSTSYYIFLIAATTFTFCSLRWLWMAVPKMIRQCKILSPSNKERPSSKECLVFPIVYVTSSVVAPPALVLMINVYSGSLNYNVNALFFHNLAFVLYVLINTYGSMRMMKHEIVNGLVRTFHFDCISPPWSNTTTLFFNQNNFFCRTV